MVSSVGWFGFECTGLENGAMARMGGGEHLLFVVMAGPSCRRVPAQLARSRCYEIWGLGVECGSKVKLVEASSLVGLAAYTCSFLVGRDVEYDGGSGLVSKVMGRGRIDGACSRNCKRTGSENTRAFGIFLGQSSAVIRAWAWVNTIDTVLCAVFSLIACRLWQHPLLVHIYKTMFQTHGILTGLPRINMRLATHRHPFG
jgi:hypothetical protein